jgi:hypothetical protein
MISILRATLVAAAAFFFVGSVNAVPVKDCDAEITSGIQYGLDYLAENWEEFEQRVQAGGKEIASCIKSRIFENGTVSCDRVECPMPGMVAWTYKKHEHIYFCPWYTEERIEHIRNIENKGACLASKVAGTFAISCEGVDDEHWDYYGSIFMDMIKRDRPEIYVDGQVDCGLNRGLPFQIKNGTDKVFSM